MKKNRLNLLLTVSMVLTLLAILLYPLIPPKRFTVVPSEWRSDLIYSRAEASGSKTAQWVNQEKYHFRCNKTSGSPYNSCGLNLYFHYDFTRGVDLSDYSHLIVDANYNGSAHLVRLFIRNYNPSYSRPDDANSAKFIKADFLTTEFLTEEPIKIAVNELMVADWWIRQRELARKDLPVELSRVTVIGFDFSTFIDSDVDYNIEFEVKELAFEGPLIEQKYWYLGLLLFWMAIIATLISKQLMTLKTDKQFYQKESRKFKKLSNVDGLTGILNRLGVEKNVERIITGQRSHDIGVIVLDLDHFKAVNDSRGHDAGDLVLQQFALRIQQNLREDDVFGRWGGEEFILITPGTSKYNLVKLAEKLREKVAERPFLPEAPLDLTMSAGVAVLGLEETFQEAFKRADMALYSAKDQGRNRVVLAGSERFKSK